MCDYLCFIAARREELSDGLRDELLLKVVVQKLGAAASLNAFNFVIKSRASSRVDMVVCIGWADDGVGGVVYRVSATISFTADPRPYMPGA